MGIVAKYFQGAATFEYLEKKTFSDIWFLYKIYEFQSTWDEVIQELSHDEKGRKKTLPSHERIKEIVEAKISERIEESKRASKLRQEK